MNPLAERSKFQPKNLDLAITIPVFNELAYTVQCLESLQRAGIADAQIIMVNNGSTDGTAEFLATRPQLCVIHNPKNLGCGTAWSQGSQVAQAVWTVVSNNDVLFAPATLPELIRFAGERGADIASPAMCEGDADYDFLPYAENFMRVMAGVTRWGVASGSCFMIHRRVFDKIGFFDCDPKLGGYEDDEYFRRSRKAGFRLAITGRSYYHHFGGTTQKSIKAGLNQPNMSLGDRAYYRKKTGQTWGKRKWNQVRHALRVNWWKHSEQLRFGHTLHEKRIAGKWIYR